MAQVGDRQQRLLRELEKLALEYGEGARVGVEEVEASCASSAERKAWTLADALVAGDGKAATRLLLELREQGDRLPSLLYQMVRRVRDALAIAEALAAGKPPGQIRRTLRMPSYAADRLIADVSNRDVESYRRALELLADLEVESRGGGGRGAERGHRRGARGHRRGPLRDELLALRRGTGAAARARGAAGARIARLIRPTSNPVHREAADPASLNAAVDVRAAGYFEAALLRIRAARDFLRAPLLRCRAPRLTALSTSCTRRRCSSSAASSSPSATAACSRRK